MLTRETKKIIKLRRRVGIAYIIVFSLIVWIKGKYDDESYQIDQNDFLQIEIEEKDKKINYLQNELDSLKSKTKTIIEIPKLNKKSLYKKDIKVEQKIDTIKKIESVSIDTLQYQ
jgi:hypothetical protein